MFLFLDTISDQITLALYDKKGKVLREKRIMARFQQSEKLLVEIDKLAGKDKKKLEGVLVVKGPGSFTSLRIGVTTANTLGYALDIPVEGIFEDEVEKGLTRISKLKKFKKFVIPEYGMEPNIG